MAKYVYPAVFSPEKDGKISIHFPDISGCFTSACSINEGIELASDALCLMLYDMEQTNSGIPEPANIKDIQVEGDEFVTLIDCDTIEYRKFYDSKAVKKTLTIPSWLNDLAEREEINFSAVLQSALKDRLNI